MSNLRKFSIANALGHIFSRLGVAGTLTMASATGAVILAGILATSVVDYCTGVLTLAT